MFLSHHNLIVMDNLSAGVIVMVADYIQFSCVFADQSPLTYSTITFAIPPPNDKYFKRIILHVYSMSVLSNCIFSKSAQLKLKHTIITNLQTFGAINT